MEKVIFKKENSIAWLILNRPDKRNAIDDDVMNELDKRLKEIKLDSNIKCIVITGTGEKAFCSGGDLSVFHQLKTAEDAEVMLHKMGAILYTLFTLPIPTIALLNGTAVGGGCEIAAACDYRIAYPHVAVGFIQGTLGITTGWGGATFLLERFPAHVAMPILTSAKRMTAMEATKMGFIQKLLPEKDQISMDQVKQKIEAWLPLSVGVLSAYKRRYLDTIDQNSLQARLDKEIKECAYLWGLDEHALAVERFLNQRS